jgi:5-methylcytosine-specific restriction enzyme A
MCLHHYGYACRICSFSFGESFGAEAASLIHVHHVEPLSESGPRQTDPVRDLIPVCPNCHLVIHSRKPCLTLDEVRALRSALRSA